MVFSDPIFVFLYLPFSLTLLLICRGMLRNAVIVLLSLLFYFWGAGAFVGLLLVSVVVNWLVASLVTSKRGLFWLWVGIAFNLAMLGWFKYAYFISLNLDSFLGTQYAGETASILLPIGISFFVFQGISYLIDVWRRDTLPEPNLIAFASYLTFFPQLIAGPVVRYSSVREDFNHPRINLENLGNGCARFAHGLFKKVVIADAAGRIADACFALSGDDMTSTAAWLGAIAYTVQIYFDFSGYSDMAIGIGMVCGIRIPENFNRPYASSTITEFWRRWHISLSTWFRDYLYIPLGGNRNGPIRTYGNLLVVFALTGLWHGAGWTFLAWGLFHGFFLIAERFFLGVGGRGLRNPMMCYFYLLPIVTLGWVLFRSESFDHALLHYMAMFQFTQISGAVLPESVLAAADPLSWAGLILGLAAILAPIKTPIGYALTTRSSTTAVVLRTLWAWLSIAIASIFVLASDYSPFLYFQF